MNQDRITKIYQRRLNGLSRRRQSRLAAGDVILKRESKIKEQKITYRGSKDSWQMRVWRCIADGTGKKEKKEQSFPPILLLSLSTWLILKRTFDDEFNFYAYIYIHIYTIVYIKWVTHL